MVLIYGSAGHPALEVIHHHLMARDLEVAYVVQEAFPRNLGLKLGSDGGGHLQVGEQVLEFGRIRSVLLDQFYVAPGADLESDDAEYQQVESWAALVALFHHLSRRCLVANYPRRRDELGSRWAELTLLNRFGLAVPETLVSSDPDVARAFLERHGGEAMARPVVGVQDQFQAIYLDDEERFERLPLAPVHFEAPLEGPVSRLVLMGSRTRTLPQGPAVPPEFRGLCRQVAEHLELELCEFPVVETPQGWVAAGIRPFISVEALGDQAVLESVGDILEDGQT